MDCVKCAKVARNPKKLKNIKIKKDLGGEKMVHEIHQFPRLNLDNTNAPMSAVEEPEIRGAESGSGGGSGVGGGSGGAVAVAVEVEVAVGV